ncbi:MAG: single-stranded-DNA-specific exonuclease RecJ [Candidatus Puniceispirillaceae bacterium]
MSDLTISQSLTGAVWKAEETSVSDEVTSRYSAYFEQHYDMPVAIAKFLAGRGLSPDTIESFLEPRLRDLLPNPSSFADMDKACQRLGEAIISHTPIGIFGDYDVDGACSAAILHRFFEAFGVMAHIHIPDRFTEGYGPNIDALEKLKLAGAELIVTVDCGITAHAPLAEADKAGMDVIVIDHHQAGTELPKAVAVVNPNRLDDTSGYGALCAAGVVFMTCVGTMRYLRDKGHVEAHKQPIDLLMLLDLVAMATICDIVPLTMLNRAFVKQGLKILKKRQNVGLRHLCDQSRLTVPPSAHTFGYLLGPRINAGGRVGHAPLGAKLLATHDDAIATSIALQLDDLNNQRKELEQKVQMAAMEKAEDIVSANPEEAVLVISGHDWHEGVIGIVAGRLKDHFHRPVIVISLSEDGIGKGSARGIRGFSLGDTIMAAHQEGMIEGGGGHAMAAGLTIKESQLASFRDYMNNAFAKQIGAVPPPSLAISFWAPLSACHKGMVDWLEKAEPFGASFHEPKFAIKQCMIKYPRWIGKDETHFSCELHDGTGVRLRAIAFGLRPKIEKPDQLLSSDGVYFDMLGRLKPDNYRGGDAVQFQIDDLALSNS